MFLANLPFRTAQLYGSSPSFARVDGDPFTWAETLERVRRLAGALVEHRARRVAVLAHNSVEYLELTFAAPIAGVTLVPMNTRLAPRELEQLLDQAAPDMMFADAAHLDMARTLVAALRSRPVLVSWSGSGEIAYESLQSARAIDPIAVDEGDDWAIMFTGGTTGLPKGVRVTRRGFAFNLQHILRDLDWGLQPRFLQTTPLFHLAALGPSYAVAAWGGVQFGMPQFTIDALIALIERHRIEATALVPTMIGWLVAHPEVATRDLSSLRAIGYGASAIPGPVLRRALDIFPGLKFNQFYGQTEAGGGLATLVATDHARGGTLLRAAGRPIVGVRLAIMDDAGKEVRRRAWGEICAQTPGLFAGYLGNPAATASALREGWLRTGDVGYLDDDGYLFVTDRLKDMIVTGGENVSSSEVESAIASHPAVRQVAVVAAPDAAWGERVHAFIHLAPGTSATPDDLAVHCRTTIAGYKCPKSFTFETEPLPLSAVGKIRKDILRLRLVDPVVGQDEPRAA